jgi:hypothetical protein
MRVWRLHSTTDVTTYRLVPDWQIYFITIVMRHFTSRELQDEKEPTKTVILGSVVHAAMAGYIQMNPHTTIIYVFHSVHTFRMTSGRTTGSVLGPATAGLIVNVTIPHVTVRS